MIAMYLKPLELELQAENTHHQHKSHTDLLIVQADGVHYFQAIFQCFFKGIHSNVDAYGPEGKRQGEGEAGVVSTYFLLYGKSKLH